MCGEGELLAEAGFGETRIAEMHLYAGWPVDWRRGCTAARGKPAAVGLSTCAAISLRALALIPSLADAGYGLGHNYTWIRFRHCAGCAHFMGIPGGSKKRASGNCSGDGSRATDPALARYYLAINLHLSIEIRTGITGGDAAGGKISREFDFPAVRGELYESWGESAGDCGLSRGCGGKSPMRAAGGKLNNW